jgi:hypothetical protein
MRAGERIIGVIAVVFAVSAAGAAVYVDEGFGGSFPPSGWTAENNASSTWYKRTGGPWGDYAFGNQIAVGGERRRTALVSPAFNAAASSRLYYRFNYSWADYEYAGNPEVRFYVNYVSQPSSYIVNVTLVESDWRERAGEVDVTTAGQLHAGWSAACGPTSRYGGVILSLDNAFLSDGPRPAVAPTSWGKVKAVFR